MAPAVPVGRLGARQDRRVQVMLFLIDLGIIAICALIAIFARKNLTWFGEVNDVTELVYPMAGPIMAGWLLLLVYTGAYRVRLLGAGLEEFRRVFNASLVAAAALGITAYLLQYPLSRGFYFLLFLTGVPALLLGRLATRRVMQRAHRKGRLLRSIVVAGDDRHIADVMAVLRRETWLGYDVVGLLTPSGRACASVPDVPVLGTPADARHAVQGRDVRAILFAEGSFQQANGFSQTARDLEGEETDLIVVPALTDISASRTEVRPVAGLPMVHIEKPQAQRSRSWAKRAFDILGASMILILLSPVMIFTALAVKLEDRGPIVFRQTRAGVRGRPFECFKFRSMVPNAEALKAQLIAQSDPDNVLFKVQNDPRVTRIGRFIRKYSIDELPQLFNVLRGEMSLIGPRPALQREVDRYEQHVMRRLDVRPGMTGLWQVSGRSDLSWEDTVRLDLYYVDNWSFLQDLNILLRTFRAVVAPSGAY